MEMTLLGTEPGFQFKGENTTLLPACEQSQYETPAFMNIPWISNEDFSKDM